MSLAENAVLLRMNLVSTSSNIQNTACTHTKTPSRSSSLGGKPSRSSQAPGFGISTSRLLLGTLKWARLSRYIRSGPSNQYFPSDVFELVYYGAYILHMETSPEWKTVH